MGRVLCVHPHHARVLLLLLLLHMGQPGGGVVVVGVANARVHDRVAVVVRMWAPDMRCVHTQWQLRVCARAITWLCLGGGGCCHYRALWC